jgi:hypothetical protein
MTKHGILEASILLNLTSSFRFSHLAELPKDEYLLVSSTAKRCGGRFISNQHI